MPPDRPDHHTDRGFRNPPGSPEQRADASAYWRFVWRRVLRRQGRPAVPDGHVLTRAEAAAGLARHAGGESLTWLGHAAFLVRIGGKSVLLDPYLGDFASPFAGFGPRRFVPAAFGPHELPPIDVLIVSHNHYDHLCAATLAALPGKA